MGKIYLDFDGVIANSIESICKSFSIVDGVKYDHTIVNTWNFHNVIPHANEKSVENMFNSHLFWDNLKLFDGVKEFVDKYRDDIIICSIGSVDNQIKKLAWIKKNLGEVDMLPVVTKMDRYPKSIDKTYINMGIHDIFIEDSISNLYNSTAGTKILFSDRGFDCEWNNVKDRLDAFDLLAESWEEIDRLIKIIKK